MVDILREMWIKQLEDALVLIPNTAYVGAGLVPHADHIIKTMEKESCRSVLCIGQRAAKSLPLALLKPLPAGVTWHGVKMLPYVIPPNLLMTAPRKAFDMVIVSGWAGSIALAEQQRLAGILRGLAVKVLYVIETLREHKPAEPGVMQRPDGWDRADWCFNFSHYGPLKMNLATHDKLPDGTAYISRLKTDDGGTWRRDE